MEGAQFPHYVLPCNEESSLRIPLHVSSPYHIPLQENKGTKAVEFWHAMEDLAFHKEVKFVEKQLLRMKRDLDKISWLQVISNFSAYQTFKKQYSNLNSELQWLTDLNNRDAFSRMHIPQQYFTQVKDCQVEQSYEYTTVVKNSETSLLQRLNYLIDGACLVAFFYFLYRNL